MEFGAFPGDELFRPSINYSAILRSIERVREHLLKYGDPPLPITLRFLGEDIPGLQVQDSSLILLVSSFVHGLN